jgi:ligand-binding SRPBCC domain-containing protein
LLDYRLRLHGIPLRWQSEIAVWEPPDRFVDRQTKGPYSVWVHEHTFTERDGGTLVGDRVEYAVPGGRLVQKFFVAPDLQRIFRYRHRVLEEIFKLDSRAAAS